MLLIWNLLYCSILTWKLFKSLCDEFHKKLLLTTKQWDFKKQWSQQEKNISGTSDLQGHMAYLNSIRSDQHFLAPFWSCICTTAFAIKFTSSSKKKLFSEIWSPIRLPEEATSCGIINKINTIAFLCDSQIKQQYSLSRNISVVITT